MPNTYVNKVITGAGNTLIDLSQDTVTSASHIIGGRVGHLADGSSVSGTGSKTVTYSLSSGVSANVSPDSIITGEGLCIRLLAPNGYVLSNVSVTMGGVDITNSVFAFDTKEEPTLITKSITSSGTYNASDDSADGYSSVTVNVSGGTPAISVVDTTDSNGGTVRTITALDISDTTAVASDVASGKYFYTAGGVKTAGTASGGGGTPSATAHTIYFEFSDSTDATITAYWDDPFISDAIIATTPSTYGQKTVTLAELDGVAWYEPANIPIGIELIDLSKVTNDYVINSSGQVVAEQWYSVSDYTPIASGMTFSFSGCRWFYAAFYDASKELIAPFYISNYTTESPYNSNIGDGELGSGIPANAAYIRISSTGSPDEHELSLIRTA